MIEFVVPQGGPLIRLSKGAGGVRHVAFEVPNLAETMLAYQAEGMSFLEKEPIKGGGPFSVTS